MIEIDIPEHTFAMVELLAQAENMTPAALLDWMVIEYRTADERALIAESALNMKGNKR
ncbi:hypothetical protein [Ralstonia soli]|uniref:Uncharacterized protein n=1 Tax=Ralstonia soli TaxID=2953896 RepID=A0ABT1AQM2_9RALS|nr:hypothetical protein [Ralstonia soli]MCO5400745.1 hypothetical protein [Ralstonia soli]